MQKILLLLCLTLVGCGIPEAIDSVQEAGDSVKRAADHFDENVNGLLVGLENCLSTAIVYIDRTNETFTVQCVDQR